MKIFFSYTRSKDQFGAANDFHKHLKNEIQLINPGSSVFFDLTNISEGSNFPEVIKRALVDADILILLLSPAWLLSEWCRREFDLFTADGKDKVKLLKIIPILWVATPQILSNSPDPIACKLASIQHADWRNLRHELWSNPEKSKQVAALATVAANIFQQYPSAKSTISIKTFHNISHVQEKILRTLEPTNSLLTPQELSQRLGISEATALADLQKLQKMFFVRPRLRVGQHETPWRISEDGQAYLTDRTSDAPTTKLISH